MGVDLRSNAIDTLHALRTSGRATPQSVPPNLQLAIPKPSCRKLFWQLIRRAASPADCTAGNSSEVSIPMIEITTSNSTKVKPRLFERISIGFPLFAYMLFTQR